MLLKNCRLLIEDQRGPRFEEGDIRIQQGIIREVGKDLSQVLDEEILDLNGDMVIPGLINSHYHSYTNILRGLSYGEPLEMWSQDTVELGRCLNEEDMILSCQLGIIEMLKNGVVGFIDHIPHLDHVQSIARHYQQLPLRVGLAPMIHNVSDAQILKDLDQMGYPKGTFPNLDDYRALLSELIREFHDPTGELQVFLGVNSPQRADDDLLDLVAELAERYDLPLHCHALESRWQKASAIRDGSPIQKLNRHGLLTQRTSVAHGIWLDFEELDIMAEKGVTVVTNPTSNAFLGSGLLPIEAYLQRDIPLALGSDGLNCGTNHNMVEILRFFLLTQRQGEPDHRKWLSLALALDLLIHNGQRLLGIQGGTITPGARADLVVIDSTNFLDLVPESLLNQLLFHHHLPIARHVLIKGKFALRDGKVLLLDEMAVRNQLHDLRQSLGAKLQNALILANAKKMPYEKGYRKLMAIDND